MDLSLMATEAFDALLLHQRAIEVFYSYSHKDEALRDELDKHLTILRRQGVIGGWHDRKITAGREWAGEIDRHLDSAQIILLLISADFLASDYCYDVEMRRAMERHERGEARVISVMLRDVDWHDAPFAKLQVLPTDAKPVANWPNHDQAFKDVAVGIRKVVKELLGPPKQSKPVGPPQTPKQAPVEILKVTEQHATPPPQPVTMPVRAPERASPSHPKKYFLIAAIIAVLCGGVAYFALRDPELSRLQAKDWRQAAYNDPDFSSCRGIQPCLEKKAEAEKLSATRDWMKVPYNSSLFNDCMGFEPCVARKKLAEKLVAIDWTKVSASDRTLFADCMDYGPCIRAKVPEISSNNTPSVKKVRPDGEDTPPPAPSGLDIYKQR